MDKIADFLKELDALCRKHKVEVRTVNDEYGDSFLALNSWEDRGVYALNLTTDRDDGIKCHKFPTTLKYFLGKVGEVA